MAVNRNRAVVMGSTSIRRELLDKPRLLFAFRIFILVACIVPFSLPFSFSLNRNRTCFFSSFYSI